MINSYKTCPLCNSDGIAHHLTAKDHLLTGREFEIWKCVACGFLFTQNAPAADEIGKYYQSHEYVSHSDTRKGLMNKIYHMGRNFMLHKKFGMVDRTAKSKKLLDIGCGTGYFPAFMQQKGYRVAGVEVDQKAREFAEKQHGIEVYSPEEFLGERIVGRFDVITLWHVLEHLDDFGRYVGQMLKQLEPGGTLVIALPNCNSLDARFYNRYWAGYDVPRHLWHFTPATLNILAGNHNLKVTAMKRLPLDPFYNSMLSEKYKGNKLYLISGTIIGKLAYIESLFSIKKSSSIVYFLKRIPIRENS